MNFLVKVTGGRLFIRENTTETEAVESVRKLLNLPPEAVITAEALPLKHKTIREFIHEQ